MAKDNWPDLCESVKADDGLRVRDVGDWTEDKLVFWNEYVCITTNAMIPMWRSGLFYVDLFAGPGICKVRTSDKRIPGSPLIAASAPKPFKRILLSELDPVVASACNERLLRSAAADRFAMYQGDCNVTVSEIVRELPREALTLAFLDPEALDVRFETVGKLASAGKVDLLVLFADAYDVVRNVDRYEAEMGSKLDQMLGPKSNWREAWAKLDNRTGANVRELFSDLYERQLREQLGYLAFGRHTIRSQRGPLYKLIYASKSERGADFWEKATTRDKGGQSNLFRP